MPTTTTKTANIEESPMPHTLHPVLSITEDLELSEADTETLLAVAENIARSGDETTEVQPYDPATHRLPVNLQHPLVVIRSVTVTASEADGYVIHLEGASYAPSGVGSSHPLAKTFRKRGIPGPDGLRTVPAWHEVEVEGAHVVGWGGKGSHLGRTLVSGVKAGSLDRVVRVVLGAEGFSSWVQPKVGPTVIRTPADTPGHQTVPTARATSPAHRRG